MPNRYYTLPASLTGQASLLNAFLNERNRVHAIEQADQAQADAQTNAAWANAFGNVAGGITGAIAGNILSKPQTSTTTVEVENPDAGEAIATDAATGKPIDSEGRPTTITETQTTTHPGLSPMERLSLATSFVPDAQNISRTAGRIGEQQSRIEAQKQLQASGQAAALERIQAGGAEARATDAASAYADLYGGNLPATAEQAAALGRELPEQRPIVGPGGSGFIPTPGGAGRIPMPVYNPASTADYRKAQQVVSAYDNISADENGWRYHPDEQRAKLQALQPHLGRARKLLEQNQPPPPPSSWKQVVESGRGLFQIPGTKNMVEFNPKTGAYTVGRPLELQDDQEVESRVRQKVSQGMDEQQARAMVLWENAHAQVVRMQFPDGKKGVALVDPKTGKATKWDEDNAQAGGKAVDYNRVIADVWDDLAQKNPLNGEITPPTTEQVVQVARDRIEAARRLESEGQAIEAELEGARITSEQGKTLLTQVDRLIEQINDPNRLITGDMLAQDAERAKKAILEIGAAYPGNDSNPEVKARLRELRRIAGIQ